VLPFDEADRLFDIVTERKRSNRMSGVVPSQSPVKATKKHLKNKVKKSRISKDDGFDPDMQTSSGDALGISSL
jgi:hypothetical protein